MIPLRAFYKEAQLLVWEAKALVKTALAERKQRKQQPQAQPQPDKAALPSVTPFQLFFLAAAFVASVIVLTAVLWPLIVIGAAFAFYGLYRKLR